MWGKFFAGSRTRAFAAVACCGALAAGIGLVLFHRRSQQRSTKHKTQPREVPEGNTERSLAAEIRGGLDTEGMEEVWTPREDEGTSRQILPDYQKQTERSLAAEIRGGLDTEGMEEVWTPREDEGTSRQILPGYQKQGLLGSGSFGFVVACQKREGFGATKEAAVAIKVFSKADVEMAPDRLKELKTEKEALQACDSPFVLHLVETSQDTNNVFFVTELLVGGNVHKLIESFDKKGLPAAHVRFYAANVVEALTHLHSKGYAHRDLKPENLMIDAQGYIRVVDMSMARRIPYDAPDEKGIMRTCTRAFSHVGTPLYMAPELYASTGHNKSVDIWALGVMVFEMLEGRNPFDLKKEEKVFAFNAGVTIRRKVMETNLEPVKVSRKFGVSCRDFVEKTMAHNANERVRMCALKEHPWLEGVDWEALRAKRLPAPWKPDGGPCYDGIEGWDGEDFEDEYTGDQTIFEGF